MKILLTINDISITGGAERVCVNLANALCECGHSVEIVSFYRKNHSLPYDTQAKLNFIYDFGEDILRAKMLSNPLKRLYFKNLHKFILSLKIRRCYKNIHFIITNDWTFMPILKRKGTHYIKIHHSKFEGRYNTRNNLFDILVLLSSAELGIWQTYHNNVRVIPNFLPQIPSQNTDYTQKVVLSVGRMDNGDQKGFLRLLDIWKLVQDKIASQESGKSTNSQSGLPRKASLARNDNVANDLTQWKLVIVGDGILKDEIKAKIHALNLQQSIILKPFTKDIESEYLGASIYAMSSHFEGFGMVLAEASSYALPCIAFDIATGPSDIIENHQSGFLIADNDLETYANKLITLMSDENLRAKFGAEAKRLVGERFSREVIMERWQRLFDENWSKR